MRSIRFCGLLVVLAAASSLAWGQACAFKTSGSTMTLQADCLTSSPIIVPNGMTLNGANHTITAVDPQAGNFAGAVIQNAPGAASANVKGVIVDTPNVSKGACNEVDGIWFDSVAGSISGNTILHAGPASCALGSGINVTNSAGVARTINIASNRVLQTNEFGINIEDNFFLLTVNVTNNEISLAPAGAADIYAQGTLGTISGNLAETNTTGQIAIATYQNPAGLKIQNNNINLVSGVAYAGLLIDSDNTIVSGNRVFNYGTTKSNTIGIYNAGYSDPSSNSFSKNEVRCYGTPFIGTGGSNGNVVLTCPW